jgi:protein-histidine N-methyltransferase
MAEANSEENDNDNLLAGLERGDLSSGIYEGGFKTWECAVDLASLVASTTIEQDLHVIELGAGSAIPSLVLLQKALNKTEGQRTSKVHFTICDYNEDVLRLATAPNVLLTYQTRGNKTDYRIEDGEHELEDIDSDTVAETIQAFNSASISFDYISGGWGEDFIKLIDEATVPVEKNSVTLILASETIYSPSSMRIFADSLVQLLRKNSKASKAWVAAKKIYFGVGGGVEDFKQEIEKRGGTIRSILDLKDAGVARVVMEVTAN